MIPNWVRILIISSLQNQLVKFQVVLLLMELQICKII